MIETADYQQSKNSTTVRVRQPEWIVKISSPSSEGFEKTEGMLARKSKWFNFSSNTIQRTSRQSTQHRIEVDRINGFTPKQTKRYAPIQGDSNRFLLVVSADNVAQKRVAIFATDWSLDKTKQSSDRTPESFLPSLALAKYLKEVLHQTGCNGDLDTAAQQLIKKAVLGLFNTLASSVQDSGRSPPYPLANRHEFSDPITKALLHRIPIKFSDANVFFEQLRFEVALAAKRGLIRGPFWTLEPDRENFLHIKVDPKNHQTTSASSSAEVISIY